MAGSVREWVQDAADDDPTAHILRGGSWISTDDELLTYAQTELPADLNSLPIDNLVYWDVGFRCAMPLSAKP
ncbi:MAG: hypothetical protein P8183_14030 [Anaerolineae bacterium]